MPRSTSVLPGSTWTSPALARQSSAVRGSACERAWPARAMTTAIKNPGSPRGPVASRGASRWAPFRPSRGATMVERLANDGGLQEAEPAGWRGRVFLDRGQEPGRQLGMLGLDLPGHPARVADRAQGGQRADHAAATTAAHRTASSHPVGIRASRPSASRSPRGRRRPRPRRASRAPGPVQSRTCRKRCATRSSARRSSVLMSSRPPRGPGGVDRPFAPPARFRRSGCR